jgi:glycosyltransferase involved in cell wall biosynthesis
LAPMAAKLGIKLYPLEEPPCYKLGDGKWQIKTANGEYVNSVPKNLYRISEPQFDIINVNHKPITEHLLRLYPNTPIVATIHSEVIALEEPVISEQIKKYVAIRPEIKEFLIDKYEINPSDIKVVYNPINYNKFKEVVTKPHVKPRIIFVGTIDYLRRETIQDLITTTKESNTDLWIVGKKNATYLPEMMLNQDHVTYFEPTANVEKLVQECDQTAGILLGRTTIEGWLCGKGGWIYTVNNAGNILNKEFHPVPKDVNKFRSDLVAGEILELYKTIIE